MTLTFYHTIRYHVCWIRLFLLLNFAPDAEREKSFTRGVALARDRLDVRVCCSARFLISADDEV